jgi:hypothetical protein
MSCETVTIKFVKCASCSRPVFVKEIPAVAPCCVICMAWARAAIIRLSTKRVLEHLSKKMVREYFHAR